MLKMSENSAKPENDLLVPHNHYKSCTLKIWRNGFSINNGELRELDRSFMTSVMKGKVPLELANQNIQSVTFEFNRKQNYTQHVSTPSTKSNTSKGSYSDEDEVFESNTTI